MYGTMNLKQLNMFRASSCPSSGATTTAVAASGLPSERGGSSAVGREKNYLKKLDNTSVQFETFFTWRRFVRSLSVFIIVSSVNYRKYEYYPLGD